jgi:hypothetical protein
MAITDINISEQLQTGAPSIRYSGTEGPQSPQQHKQAQMIAQQIWEALGPEQQSQFQSFEEFFRSGVWKQILAQMQQDEAQGSEQQQGIGSLGPQPMEQPAPMPNRMGARFGGDMEELSMRETIDTPGGIETLNETETMKMAGGGERGWKAQLLADEWAWERHGKEFYDLSQIKQIELYSEALDFIDSGGE